MFCFFLCLTSGNGSLGGVSQAFLFDLVGNNVDDDSPIFGSAIAFEEWVYPKYRIFGPYAYHKGVSLRVSCCGRFQNTQAEEPLCTKTCSILSLSKLLFFFLKQIVQENRTFAENIAIFGKPGALDWYAFLIVKTTRQTKGKNWRIRHFWSEPFWEPDL